LRLNAYKKVIFSVLVSSSLGANAGLNDEFIFSSKFGLTTESVTDTWTSLEDGLMFGGQLNGVPRDTKHDLFYTNGRLSLVNIFYRPDQLNFETEKASRKWIYFAAEELVARASKKYGKPVSSSLECGDSVNYIDCRGSAIWKGEKKVFMVSFFEKPFSKYRKALFGYGKTTELVVTYSDVKDYDLSKKRLPFLVKRYNELSDRLLKARLNSIFRYELTKKNISLEDFILNYTNLVGKINEIKRKESISYIGGVKSNYDPKKWAKSFRLQ
jgi:hypothetical protein